MCRRAGVALCGRPNCPSAKRPYPPGMHGRGRKRISEYQVRLLEKQKLRHIYGVGERQMRTYYDRASRKSGVTGEEMIRQLETRLDAVVQRLGFALSQRQAFIKPSRRSGIKSLTATISTLGWSWNPNAAPNLDWP